MVFSSALIILSAHFKQQTADQIASSTVLGIISNYSTYGLSYQFDTTVQDSATRPDSGNFVGFADFALHVNDFGKVDRFRFISADPKFGSFRAATALSIQTLTSRALNFTSVLGSGDSHDVLESTYDSSFLAAHSAIPADCAFTLRPLYGTYPYDEIIFGFNMLLDPYLGVPTSADWYGHTLPTPPAPPTTIVSVNQAVSEALNQSNLKYGDQSILLRHNAEVVLSYPIFPSSGELNLNGTLKYYYRVDCWNSQGRECFFIDSVSGNTAFSRPFGFGFGRRGNEPKRFDLGQKISLRIGKKWNVRKLDSIKMQHDKPKVVDGKATIIGKLFAGSALTTKEPRTLYFPYFGGYVRMTYK